MSEFQSKTVARLLEEARLLVAQTSGQRTELDAFVTAAQDDVDRAEALAVDATTGDVYQVRRLLRLHLYRTTATVLNAKQLRHAAEEYHALACRLLAELNGKAAETPPPNASRGSSVWRKPEAPSLTIVRRTLAGPVQSPAAALARCVLPALAAA